MRKFEFRGNLTNNRGWAYGNLIIKPNNECEIITPDDTPIGKYGKVDINTIGQYIGIKDKNGTKIFEGDIVQINKVIYVIRFGYHIAPCSDYPYDYGNAYGFYLENNDERFSIEKEDVIEVIGNVYDNPELLEDK